MGEKWKAIKTTILGVAAIVVSGLVLFGVISPSEQTELSGFLGTLLDGVTALILAASGIINIFRAD